jgi:hypothetical protein
LEAFFLVLDSYTLADLVTERGTLTRLLDPSEPSLAER